MQAQRYSFQREKIYEVVRESCAHPTAEMVFSRLKPEIPRLSLGTVYRNLHQMAEEGRLRELPGPTARFDANVAPHTHFCCTVCGAVSDVPLAYDPALDCRVAEEGLQVAGHMLTFYGVCPACAVKEQVRA